MGMMMAMGLADAYGAGFEYVDPRIVKAHNHLRSYLRHPKWKGPPGMYTDDTQMCIALAELMTRKDPMTWTHYDIARAFVATFKRDSRPGYSGNFYRLLQQMETGWDFLRAVQPNSDKSGGAMRAPVIGLLPKIDQVAYVARLQASLTHCTPIGMDAAVASALMTHYFYYRLGPKQELPWFLDSKGLCIGFAGVWDQPVNSRGDEHVLAALTAIVMHDTMEDILRASVAFTGDVDTVAAIALAAASFSDEVDQGLPAGLVDNLEDGKFGRDFLTALDDRLMEKFPRPEQNVPEGGPQDGRVAEDGPALWHCTDCGYETRFDDAEPEGDLVSCPECGGLDSLGKVHEPDDLLISDLFEVPPGR